MEMNDFREALWLCLHKVLQKHGYGEDWEWVEEINQAVKSVIADLETHLTDV